MFLKLKPHSFQKKDSLTPGHIWLLHKALRSKLWKSFGRIPVTLWKWDPFPTLSKQQADSFVFSRHVLKPLGISQRFGLAKKGFHMAWNFFSSNPASTFVEDRPEVSLRPEVYKRFVDFWWFLTWISSRHLGWGQASYSRDGIGRGDFDDIFDTSHPNAETVGDPNKNWVGSWLLLVKHEENGRWETAKLSAFGVWCCVLGLNNQMDQSS